MKTSGCHHCGENRYLRKGTRKNKTGLRILSAGLSLSMLLTGCGPLSITPLVLTGVGRVEAASQESGDNADRSTDTVITGFGSLPDEVREQTVPVGTELSELNLPDTLGAYMSVETEDGTEDGEKPDDGDKDKDQEKDPGDEDKDQEKDPGDEDRDQEKDPGDEDGDKDKDQDEGSGSKEDEQGKPDGGENNDGENSGGENNGGDNNSGDNGGENNDGNSDDNNDATRNSDGGTATDAPEASDAASDSADNSNSKTAGFVIQTGSFAIPVYASENTQDDLMAGMLTDGAPAADEDSIAPNKSTNTVNEENETGEQTQADTRETDSTGGTPDSDGTDAQPDTADTQEKVTIEDITWESAPAYDADTQGVYVFTPILPEGYALAEDVSLPEITVNVGCIHGIVGAGEVCPVCELQEQIDGLPDAEEVEEALYGMLTGTSRMSAEEIDALYELLCTLSDTYEGFQEEWQAMVDAERLSALLALFSGEDMLMTTAGGKDVLIFSTKLRTGLFGNAPAMSYLGVLDRVFEDEGYGVQKKYGTATEQHLTETDTEGIGLLILGFPNIAPNDTDISLMRDFLAGGGRIVMIGENGKAYAKENAILSAAAEKLGADFRISDEAIGGRCSISKGTADMPENALTKDVKQSLTCNFVAPIIYTGSTEPVLLLDGQAWMVDQAAGRGRITALSDVNCFDSLPYSPFPCYADEQEKADTKAWILRWLLDARDNQQMVLTNKDPNLGFGGGSPGASVDAKEHMATLGDYSFTVTYSGSDKSPDGVIDETTIGTDDVTVTDSAGASLHINGAQIISGQGTKKLTVRYTVEAQQSDFTPGDYIIGIVNKAVSDKAGKQVGGNPKAAVFRVIASPLKITGPDNLVIPKGGTGSLSVTASTMDGKSYSYRYQWYQKKNGVYEAVTGATNASYTLPAAVTGVSGEYTYRCEVWANGHTEFRIPSQDALVTVEKGLAIDTPTATEIAGKDCDYTLSATLLEAGSDRITETGFVWGIMASPTLSLNSGSAKTASPVTAANQKITASATGLTKTVTYYGRAYVKTAGGNVVYSNAVSFGKTGSMGQFSVKNNGNNTFTVTLANGVGEQMVFYRTVNGSAVGGTHFTHKAGMLTFNGSGSQTVTVSESAVTSTYGGKATTAYSNADRTYSLEIYRPMGGAAISTGTATRTMKADDSYRVFRTYYNGLNKEVSTTLDNGYVADRTAKRTDDRVFFSSDRKDKDGGALNNVPDPHFSGFYKNFNIQRNMDSYFTEKEKAYLKATSEGYLYRLYIYAREDYDGWEHIWIAKHAPDRNAFNTSNGHDGPIGLDDSVKGAAQFTARWDIKGPGSDNGGSVVYSELYFPQGTGTNLDSPVVKNVRDGAQEGDFLLFGLDDTVNVWFGASGKDEDIWYVYQCKDWVKMKDTVEPRLLGVAPMAQTAYAIGDNITIALVFDEIVDVTNSTLSNVKIKTNVTNDLSYSGGGNTNVLYFTGKVTTEFKSGDIQVNGITGSSYIKDMCETDGTANTSTSGSTPISTTGSSAPKLTLINNDVTDGVAKAQITTQNATLLQYCWTQDAGMPAAGWHKAGSTSYTATNPAQTAGTYYLHAMAIKQDTGEAAYEKTSFTVTAKQQQEQESKLVLTAETDNSQWARSRTIRLEKKGSGSLTLTVKKPDGTTQTVTGDSYTANANGNYIFTLSNGSKTVTQPVAVSKIDRTNPKVTVGGIPTAWQPSVPSVTISGTDTGGSGIVSLQYKWVTTKGAYPTSSLTSLSGTGVNVSGTASGSGVTDGVNYLYYKAVDAVGNTTQGYSSALRLDRITPTITLGAAQVDGANAVFSVVAKYGPSGGKATYQKQGDSTVLSVRGSTKGISETTYKFRLDATTGVNEAGSYIFTVASGAGKTAAKNAPGIYQITLNAGEGVFQSDMRGEDEEPSRTDIWLVVSGGKLIQPTYGAPVREHYTLKGWYTNANCTTAYNFNTTVTGDKTLYAGWTPDSYKVAYEKNGGTITNETTYQKYTYSTGLTLPTASQTKRTGYTFAGWYTDEAFADDTKVTKLTATDAGDKIFYAKWTANQYRLTYDYQGATGGNGTASKQVTYDAAYGDLPAPEKTGYSFKGWYTQADGKGTKISAATKMTRTQAHTLYAYWVDDLKPDAPVLQDGVTLPTDWTHTQKTIPLTLHDGVGVTELWVSVDDGTYTKVNGFNGQPGNDSYDYVYGGVQEENHTYRFQAKDAARNVSNASEAFTVKLDTTEAGLTVTGPNTGAEKEKGVVLTLTSGSFGISGGVLSAKKEGQTEETALKDSAGSGVLETSYTVKETGTYHFYSRTNANKAADAGAAQTRYVRQVTFDSQGGSEVEPQLVWTSRTAGDAVGGTAECRVKKPADPSYRGRVFGGWYTDQACTNAFDFDTQIYEDTTLYAKWTADVYGVTYHLTNPDGSAYAAPDAYQTYVFGVGLTLPVPEQEGYQFSGWYLAEDYMGEVQTAVGEDETEAKEYYARYVDIAAPKITAQLSAESEESGWYITEPAINLIYSDNQGVKRLLVSVDGAEWQELSGFPTGSGIQDNTEHVWSYEALRQGDHTYAFQAVDAMGLSTETDAVRVKLDTTKPVIGELSYENKVITLWQWIIGKKSMVIHVPVTDAGSDENAGSGVKRISYTMTPKTADGTPDANRAKTKTAVIEDGEAKIVFDEAFRGDIAISCTDAAGNDADIVTVSMPGIDGVIVEDTAPVITVTADRLPTEEQAGAGPEGEALSADYYQTAPELIIKVQDGSMAASGIKEVKWRIGSGNENTEDGGFGGALKTEYGFRIALSGQTGTAEVEISAVDNAGNSESKSVTVKIKGKEQTPEAETDYPAEKLTGLKPGETYLVRLPGGKTVTRKADENGEISIDNGWFGKEISLIKKGDGKNTKNSDPQSLVLAARPAAPALEKSDETIKGKNDGQVTGVTDVMEISRDGKKTWERAAGTVTDAASGKLWARLAATRTAPCGEAAFVTIKEGRTLTVTFDSQGGSKVKPIKGLSWKEAVKKPVDPKKEGDNGFCGWYRETACENKWHFASEPEEDLMTDDVTLWAKWLPKTDTPMTVGISYRDETLTKLEPGRVYLIEGKEVTASAEGTVPIDESWFGKKISIVRRGDGTDTGDSDALHLDVPKRPAGPAKVQPKPESEQDAKDGKLTKTDTTMQYRKQGSTEWITVTGEEITNLEPGDYELRYVSTDTAFSSKIVVKTVKKYSPPKKGNGGSDDGSGNDGGNSGNDNGGGNDQPGGKKPGDGTEPGGGTNPGDDMKPGDGKKPGDGTEPGGGKKPGDGTEPGGGKKPGDSTEPGGGKKPGDGTEPGGGKKPGDGTEPGGGKKPGDGTEPGGGKNPGDGTEPGGSTDLGDGKPPIGDDVPVISVTIQDGVIVIGTPPDGSDGVTGGGSGNDGGNRTGSEDGVGSGGHGDVGSGNGGIYTGTTDDMPAARTVLQMYGEGGNPTGAVIVTVVCEEQECTAGVADTMAVANAVLTPEQLGLVQKGETIEIRIDVTDISEDVPPQDQEVIESGIGAYQKEHPQLTLGMYVDISMFIRTGDSGWNAVTETKKPVEVVIGIPEKLRSGEREFYIIRAHNGEYTFMNDMDEAADTITISTNLFSSYAIAYVETDGTGADETKCGLCHICPTFLGICYFIWLAFIIAVIAIVVLAVLHRKKEEEPEERKG